MARKVAGWALIVLGILFIGLGIWAFVRRLLECPTCTDPVLPPEGIASVITALADLVVSLTGAPSYVSATVLGLLLVVAGVFVRGGG